MSPASAPPAELDDVRATRRGTLKRVSPLPQALLDRRPAPGRWSVGEVLDHLILSDAVYLGDITRLFEMAARGERPILRRSFADLDVSVAGFPKQLLPLAEVPFAFANLFMPRSLRDLLVRSRWLPAENPDATAPRPRRPKEELVAELEAFPDRVAALFTAHPGIDGRDFVYYHPVLGTNDLPRLLAFVSNHERRHQAQIGEILARLDKAGQGGDHA